MTDSLSSIPQLSRGRDGFAKDTLLRFHPDSNHHDFADDGLGFRADPSGSQLVDGLAVLFSNSSPRGLAAADSGNFADESPGESSLAGRAADHVGAGREPLDSAYAGTSCEVNTSD